MESGSEINMDRGDIESLIPQRGRALMLDRCTFVISERSGRYLIAHYKVPPDSWWVEGHFPDQPIMPGTMVLEFAAQACGLFGMLCNRLDNPSKDKLHLFPIHARSNKVRYQSPVFPGDVLIATVTLIRTRRNFWNFSAVVENASGAKVLSAQITGAAEKGVTGNGD